MEQKECTKCEVVKDLGEFHNEKYGKDGKRTECKVCFKEYYKEYIEKNKEHIKERNKIYYIIKKDYTKERNKKYAKNNRGITNAITAKRRSKKFKATPPWLTKEHYDQIKEYYQAAKLLAYILDEPIHVDHIIPLQGKHVSGLHVPWNLQLLTESENLSKGNRL